MVKFGDWAVNSYQVKMCDQQKTDITDTQNYNINCMCVVLQESGVGCIFLHFGIIIG